MPDPNPNRAPAKAAPATGVGKVTGHAATVHLWLELHLRISRHAGEYPDLVRI